MGISRAKVTMKSSKEAENPMDEEESTPPSPEQWKKMEVFKCFSVSDDEGNDFRFDKEQVVLVLPNGFDPELPHARADYWAAKIKEIRAEKDDEEGQSSAVWTKVQWFYSGKDVSDVIKSFDRKAVGKLERIFSDHYDYIRAESYESVIPMYKLNEDDPDQRYIPDGDFYRRYTFEYRVRNLQPKPGLKTCICHIPYNPNDMDLLNLMHFCPRPSCRKAYHHQCLLAEKSKESPLVSKERQTAKIPSFNVSSNESVRRSARKHAAPPKAATRKVRSGKKNMDHDDQESTSMPSSSRAHRLLSCSPDTDEILDLQDLIPPSIPDPMTIDSATESYVNKPPKKKPRGHPLKARPPPKAKNPEETRTTRPLLAEVLSTLPQNLVNIAMQPLVRGGAFPAGGVAGNIGMVTQSRRLVYAALQMGGGPGSVPDDWQDKVFGDDRQVLGVGLENAIVDVKRDGSVSGKKDKELPPFLCPNCRSAI